MHATRPLLACISFGLLGCGDTCVCAGLCLLLLFFILFSCFRGAPTYRGVPGCPTVFQGVPGCSGVSRGVPGVRRLNINQPLLYTLLLDHVQPLTKSQSPLMPYPSPPAPPHPHTPQLANRLFDVEIVAADGESRVWHPDVRFFKVLVDGKPKAYFYLDPYSRQGGAGGHVVG